ncbi:MAG: TetR/AcrR family transcriptional regulator [Actinobacteria bacterium ATB1]|nr:TetR/AcrR family transcriptional regulator [Actinobacteria bacterium ATB1]
MAETARGRRTREKLTDVSLALFSARGFDAVTVDEICETAGVAKGTFYVHFERKEDVMLSALGVFLGETADRVTQVGDTEQSFLAAMREAVDILSALTLVPRELIIITIRELLARRDDFLSYSREGRDLAALLLARFFDNATIATVLRWAQTEDSPEALKASLEDVVMLVLDGITPRS